MHRESGTATCSANTSDDEMAFNFGVIRCGGGAASTSTLVEGLGTCSCAVTLQHGTAVFVGRTDGRTLLSDPVWWQLGCSNVSSWISDGRVTLGRAMRHRQSLTHGSHSSMSFFYHIVQVYHIVLHSTTTHYTELVAPPHQ